MDAHATTAPAGGPCRELLSNWADAVVVAVAPSPTGSRCRRQTPAAPRTHVEPAVLKGHGTARKRFWGVLPPRRKSSRRPGQRGAGRTPQSCLVPPGGVRPTTNDSGAAERAAVKRVRVLCCEWKKNPFPWKERGLTLEAIERFDLTHLLYP
jgi:hypothetical protein